MKFTLSKIIDIVKNFDELSILDFIKNDKFDIDSLIKLLDQDLLREIQSVFNADPKSTLEVFFYNYTLQQNRINNYQKRYKKDIFKEKEEKEEPEKVSDYHTMLNIVTDLKALGNYNIDEIDYADAVICLNMIRYKELEKSILEIIEDEDDERIFNNLKYDVNGLIHFRNKLHKQKLEKIKNG